MVINYKVFKKCSPNGNITLYMGRREFIDSLHSVEPIDGIIVISDDFNKGNRQIFAQLVCYFRYGREEDETMGLNFQKELIIASQNISLEDKSHPVTTKLQERLLKKLGPNAIPFILNMPSNTPASVTLQQKVGDNTQPCGTQYYVKVFSGNSEIDYSHKSSSVSFGICKIQYAPKKQGVQPCTIVRKDFLLSPGELELEVTLDKQLYHHGEKLAINVCVRNNSNKLVKKIKAMIQQGVDVILFQSGQFRHTISSAETTEGCPIQPGSSVQKVIYLQPNLINNQNRFGVAIEGNTKRGDTRLASTTLFSTSDYRDAFGMIISYSVKVKLFLGALGGELCAELPFVLMHPKPVNKCLLVENCENHEYEMRNGNEPNINKP